MTKQEFVAKMERYQQKQQRAKWEYFGMGSIFMLPTFVSEVELLVTEYFGIPSITFAILGGLCLGQALMIQRGHKEEYALLADALNLLSADKA